MNSTTIQEFVRKRFGKDANLEKLAGDASERKFYRVRTAGGSFILMQCESPFPDEELPYINIWRFLKKHGFRVPEIIESQPESGIITLSDLGDLLLQNEIVRLTEESRTEHRRDHVEQVMKALCRKSIEIIVDLQISGTRALDDDCLASRYRLDKDRFLFELGFFYEHGVKGLLQGPLTANEEAELLQWFDRLAEEVSGFGSVLCHRDFHSRNLVVFNDELYMTDFQDARLGPYTYDLASFLRDSYVSYEEDLIDEMSDYYFSRMQECLTQEEDRESMGKGAFMERFSRNFVDRFSSRDERTARETFRREFDLTCIQRNIKAIGTFAFQSQIRKNHYYLQYIPKTSNDIRKNLCKLAISLPPLDIILRKIEACANEGGWKNKF